MLTFAVKTLIQKNMKLQGMFRLPKNRKFGFTPRYYDEAREDFEYRVARAKQEARAESGAEETEEEYIPLRRGELRRSSKLLNSENKSSTVRTFLILGILLMLAYWLFYS